MIDDSFTPEEFARLMTLPVDHPDRRRAQASPRFESMRLMLESFERYDDAPVPAEQVDSASAELHQRIAATRGWPMRSSARALGDSRGVARPEPPGTRPKSDRVGVLRRLFGNPRASMGLAFAAALVVVGGIWWSAQRPEREAMRGPTDSGVFEVVEARETRGALTLRWTPVPEADGYRVVFLGDDLTEIGRLDVPRGSQVVLTAAALPKGVSAASRVSVEVVAMRDGAPISTTPARSVSLP